MSIHENPLHDHAISDLMHGIFRITTHQMVTGGYFYVATAEHRRKTLLLMRGEYHDEPTALRAAKQATGRKAKERTV